MKKLGLPKKSIKKIKISKYDAIWARMVRQRDGACLNCGETESLNAHHVITRGRKSTRLVLENGITLCAGCHVFRPDSVHRSPLGSKAFCVKIIGEDKYAELERAGNTPMPERQAISIFKGQYLDGTINELNIDSILRSIKRKIKSANV